MADELAAQIVAASITAEEVGTDRMLVHLKLDDGKTLAYPGAQSLGSLLEVGWKIEHRFTVPETQTLKVWTRRQKEGKPDELESCNQCEAFGNANKKGGKRCSCFSISKTEDVIVDVPHLVLRKVKTAICTP